MIQGATLASLAIEKYLKVLLSVAGIQKKVHLTKWKDIKNSLHNSKIYIFNELDTTFLKILEQAFKLRYYDELDGTVLFSFLSLQFLAELDFTVHLIESRVKIISAITGEVITSEYQRDKTDNKKELLEENYILNGLEKKSFMEKESDSILLFIDSEKNEYTQTGRLRLNEYVGQMLQVTNVSIDDNGKKLEINKN